MQFTNMNVCFRLNMTQPGLAELVLCHNSSCHTMYAAGPEICQGSQHGAAKTTIKATGITTTKHIV